MYAGEENPNPYYLIGNHLHYCRAEPDGSVLTYGSRFHLIGLWDDERHLQSLIPLDEECQVHGKMFLFHKDGSRAARIDHYHGKLDGRNEYYHDNGKIFGFEHNVDGLSVGAAMFYNRDAEIVLQRTVPACEPRPCPQTRAVVGMFMENYGFAEGLAKLMAGHKELTSSGIFTQAEPVLDAPKLILKS